jgi:hypothetical protein
MLPILARPQPQVKATLMFHVKQCGMGTPPSSVPDPTADKTRRTFSLCHPWQKTGCYRPYADPARPEHR